MANIFSFSDIKKNDPPPGGPPGGGGFPPGFPGGGGSPGGNRGHEDRKRVIMITSASQFRQQLQSAEGLAVVDWSAAWCKPCQQIFPILANLSEKYADVVFMKVDVDMMRSLADEHNIRALPTFHFFKKGQKIDELEGADPGALEQKIQTHHVAVKKWGGGVQLKDESTQIFTGGFVRSANDPAPIPVATGGEASNSPGGADGNVLEPLLQSLIEMGFPDAHSRQALIATGNSGLEQAIDWMVNNPEGTVAPSGGPQALGHGGFDDDEDMEDASDALKQILAARKNNQRQQQPAAPASSDPEAAPASQNPSETPSEASPTPVQELTMEEREKRIQARLAAIQEQKRIQAEQEELERERKRIKDVAAATQTREHLEEVRRNAELQEAKRKKIADKRAKDEIREKIRLAQLERASKAGGSSGGAAPAQSAPAAVAQSSPEPAARAEYNECALAIRLPNGTTVKHTFLPTDTLRTVYNFLINSNNIRNFSLVTNYPRKVYSGSALDTTTLQQAELVPRGALSVQY